MNKTLAFTALLVCLGALPARAAGPVPFLPVPHGAAVILNTGSTNALGYRIVIVRSGSAEYVSGTRRAKARVSEDLVHTFFSDLDAAMPLSQLPATRCMKSASFGTSTFLWWQGQRSPDVSCPTGTRGAALGSGALHIAFELGLQRQIGFPLHEPRRLLPEPTPTPTLSPSPVATP